MMILPMFAVQKYVKTGSFLGTYMKELGDNSATETNKINEKLHLFDSSN